MGRRGGGGGRLAAGFTLAASLARSAPAAADAHFVKGPYLTGLGAAGVDVRFELDGSLAATVIVSGADEASSGRLVFEAPSSPGLRVVRVVGLAPSTRYVYSVRAARASIGGGHFTTAPADDSNAPVTFLLYGDDRSDFAAHAAVVHAMTEVPCDFLVNTGDLVADGADAADWQSFFDVEANMLRDRAIFVSVGNHELYDDAAGANFAKYVGFLGATSQPNLYGTVRMGRVRLFFLNAMHDWASGEEHDWLVHALERADGEAGLVWRIAVAHQGPWSSGPHGPSANLVGAHIPELLAAHKVDLVLSGHDHIYERGDSGALKYIVSGGGGAPLYRVLGKNPTSRKAEAAYHFVELTAAGNSLRVVARRLDGTLLDRCGFAKDGPWDCDPPSARMPSPPVAAATASAPAASEARCGCTVPTGHGERRWAGLGLAFALLAFVRRYAPLRGLRS